MHGNGHRCVRLNGAEKDLSVLCSCWSAAGKKVHALVCALHISLNLLKFLYISEVRVPSTVFRLIQGIIIFGLALQVQRNF